MKIFDIENNIDVQGKLHHIEIYLNLFDSKIFNYSDRRYVLMTDLIINIEDYYKYSSNNPIFLKRRGIINIPKDTIFYDEYCDESKYGTFYNLKSVCGRYEVYILKDYIKGEDNDESRI